MCGISPTIWVFLITLVLVGAVVFKMRGLFKRILPMIESWGEFPVFLVICGVILFSAVGVGEFVRDRNVEITEGFRSVREKCEPPKDERTIDQFIQDSLERLRQEQR